MFQGSANLAEALFVDLRRSATRGGELETGTSLDAPRSVPLGSGGSRDPELSRDGSRSTPPLEEIGGAHATEVELVSGESGARPPPGTVHIGLEVDEPDHDVVAMLKRRGVAFPKPIVDDGSVVLAFFADRDGTVLYFCEVKAAGQGASQTARTTRVSFRAYHRLDRRSGETGLGLRS